MTLRTITPPRRLLAALMALTVCLASMADTPAAPPKARHYLLDDVGQFVPLIAMPALGLCGVEARDPWRERIALTVTSMALCEGVTYTLKHTIHSTRPDGTDRHSFPSGHAARAFNGAEIIRHEYGWGWGAGAYAVAAGVGALRIHHHRHRFGDVAAGAVTGVLTARIAVWLLPFERRLFGWDKDDRITAMVTPVYSHNTRTAGLAAAIFF